MVQDGAEVGTSSLLAALKYVHVICHGAAGLLLRKLTQSSYQWKVCSCLGQLARPVVTDPTVNAAATRVDPHDILEVKVVLAKTRPLDEIKSEANDVLLSVASTMRIATVIITQHFSQMFAPLQVTSD